jgi:hypothetical protein
MSTSPDRAVLVGTRLALSGAVLYLLEWVAIIGIRAEGPFDLGTPTGQVVPGYTGHADALAVMAGWFSIVLIGRVLFVIGVNRWHGDRGEWPLPCPSSTRRDGPKAAVACGTPHSMSTHRNPLSSRSESVYGDGVPACPTVAQRRGL